MNEPKWIPENAIRFMHDALIREHGGSYGVLDAGLLTSTQVKPKNLFYYGQAVTLFDLAAAYGYGFVKNHCFIDGNKRIALVVVDVFLQLNGLELMADEAEAAAFFWDLAARSGSPEAEQARLSQWISVHVRSL
ncbi:type II toxin-antitoxin system death-on-curing family toxin [Tumidithrix elongata RA019]|uniref:Type II toxin-antitoxin system death-on-curing family toxin n=1 Tax=Tumidithrix elongata BACA0141 TaxID=2716417 RepID=A0AAW9Q013_9CYAN|nr:type II toxin-antitoxin system death-on-curing family toxin [Tumidithrix elongata RA019]